MSDAIQRLSPQENTVLGIAAGAFDVCTTQWMLYCKTASQQRLPLTLDPRILYRGVVASAISMSLITGAQFPLTAACTQIITGSSVPRRLSDLEQISAGAMGGALSGLICGPTELLMIQQQRSGLSLIATPGNIVGISGVTGIFRGTSMAMCREALFTAGYLGLVPSLSRYARESHGLGDEASRVVGAIGGGVIVGTLSHPFDTIKTCQQGDLAKKTYGSSLQATKTLMAEGGVSRFFLGLPWRTSRMVLEMFMLDKAKEVIAPLIFPEKF